MSNNAELSVDLNLPLPFSVRHPGPLRVFEFTYWVTWQLLHWKILFVASLLFGASLILAAALFWYGA
jgi:hypothetical protein